MCFTKYMNKDRRTQELYFEPGVEYGVLLLNDCGRAADPIDVTYRPLTGDALRAVLMEALGG